MHDCQERCFHLGREQNTNTYNISTTAYLPEQGLHLNDDKIREFP